MFEAFAAFARGADHQAQGLEQALLAQELIEVPGAQVALVLFLTPRAHGGGEWGWPFHLRHSARQRRRIPCWRPESTVA